MGNTSESTSRRSLQPVHPHVRGEHAPDRSANDRQPGSSPRPWGTLGAGPSKHEVRRFIPTSVGNTSMGDSREPINPVHPHVRGEHHFAGVETDRDAGSSPRPWGTLWGSCLTIRAPRFIPTSVGNTYHHDRLPESAAVHPHVRGEHVLFFHQSIEDIGSSPRPWGTPDGRLVKRQCARFIPTSVGNTLFVQFYALFNPVHPHVRGEHIATTVAANCLPGSSPRPWGTRFNPCRHCFDERFIPTSVGNTA